jgi:hypothetical protein
MMIIIVVEEYRIARTVIPVEVQATPAKEWLSYLVPPGSGNWNLKSGVADGYDRAFRKKYFLGDRRIQELSEGRPVDLLPIE